MAHMDTVNSLNESINQSINHLRVELLCHTRTAKTLNEQRFAYMVRIGSDSLCLFFESSMAHEVPHFRTSLDGTGSALARHGLPHLFTLKAGF
jgi:hypothetical protein